MSDRNQVTDPSYQAKLVSPKESSSLLRVPLEIRTRIYHYFLNGDNASDSPNWPHLYADFNDFHWTSWNVDLRPLLLTCRKVHEELLPLLFRSINVSSCNLSMTKWEGFLNTIRPVVADCVQEVALDFFCDRHDYANLVWTLCPRNNPLWTSADFWEYLLGRISRAGIRPQRVFLHVGACRGRCVFAGVALNEQDRIALTVQDRRDSCVVYTDMRFLQALETLLDTSEVEKVVISGDYNSLWPSALATRFKLDVVCRGPHSREGPHHPLYPSGEGVDQWILQKLACR